MTERVDEQLSALLDEELDGPECELLLKRLETDSEARARYARYALIGELLRGDVVPVRGLASLVRHRLSNERLPVRPTLGGLQPILRPALGGVLAAAVAIVAVLSLQPAPGPEEPAVAAGLAAEDAAVSYTVPAAEPVGQRGPDRLEYYFLRHGDFAPLARKSTYSRVIAERVDPIRAPGGGPDPLSSAPEEDEVPDPAGLDP